MKSVKKSAQRRALWTCPNCARRFAKKNQWHSCDAHTIEHHLQVAQPRVIQTYELLVSRLRKLGPLRIDAVKSSINFSSRFHFAGVAVKKDHLRLGFLAERMIDDERIVRVEKLGPKRVALGVNLHSPDELDDALLGWLSNAYKLQSR